MNKFLETEKELAELLGWTDIVESDVVPGVLRGTPYGEWSLTGVAEGTMKIPSWTQDNAAAFELLVEHELNNAWYCYSVGVDDSNSGLPERKERFYDHADKAQALRYAIVQAVISKLKGN